MLYLRVTIEVTWLRSNVIAGWSVNFKGKYLILPVLTFALDSHATRNK